VQICHGGIIIFVIDGPEVQVGSQGAKRIFYFPDSVINIPNNDLIFYIKIAAQKINAEAFVFSMVFRFVFFSGNFCLYPIGMKTAPQKSERCSKKD